MLLVTVPVSSVLSVGTMHVLCCCMWVEFTTYVVTICELGMLWRHLIGVKEKFFAFLAVTPYGGEC